MVLQNLSPFLCAVEHVCGTQHTMHRWIGLFITSYICITHLVVLLYPSVLAHNYIHLNLSNRSTGLTNIHLPPTSCRHPHLFFFLVPRLPQKYLYIWNTNKHNTMISISDGILEGFADKVQRVVLEKDARHTKVIRLWLGPNTRYVCVCILLCK